MTTTRWQYRVVDQEYGLKAQFSADTQRTELQATLDGLGQQGWELVSVVMPAMGAPTRLVLKRPA